MKDDYDGPQFVSTVDDVEVFFDKAWAWWHSCERCGSSNGTLMSCEVQEGSGAVIKTRACWDCGGAECWVAGPVIKAYSGFDGMASYGAPA